MVTKFSKFQKKVRETIDFMEKNNITRSNQSDHPMGYIDGYKIDGVDGFYTLSNPNRTWRQLYYWPNHNKRKHVASISLGIYGGNGYDACGNEEFEIQFLSEIVSHKERLK